VQKSLRTTVLYEHIGVKLFVERWPENCLNLPLSKVLFLRLKTSFRISVLIKKGKQTEMNATRCEAKFLTSRHVRMHSSILHIKYAEKTDDYGLGFDV